MIFLSESLSTPEAPTGRYGAMWKPRSRVVMVRHSERFIVRRGSKEPWAEPDQGHGVD